MLIAIAAASALSLQLETGWLHMSSAPDDFWYEQALPHTTDFDSQPFGAGLKFEHGPYQITTGWRNLGNQHQSAMIMGDAAYFACKDHPATCSKPTQYWTETGSEQQIFGEVGYSFRFGSWSLVPHVGFAETRVTSHVLSWKCPQLTPQMNRDGTQYGGGGNVQHLPRGFAGLTLNHGAVGIGFEYLQTQPNRGANSWTSPIQGSTAIYVRLTYSIPLR